MFSLKRRETYSKRYFKDFLKKESLGQCSLNRKKAIFLLLASFYGFTASAERGHIPRKMPVMNAELVGMSTQGLNRIDELMQEHMNLGHIQGGVTVVARRGKVVHFSTHGEMDSNNGRAMETDTIFAIASMTKPVLGVAAMIAIEDGLSPPVTSLQVLDYQVRQRTSCISSRCSLMVESCSDSVCSVRMALI